jgi:hypothetical protein
LEHGIVPERPRSIQMWAVFRDPYRKDGSVNEVNVPPSRIEQMNAKTQPYGFEFLRANDGRAGGWVAMFQMLRDGELVICSHGARTIEMLQTLLRDPKKFHEILKVKGDPLDDLADGLRYGVMTWKTHAVKPKEEVIAEAIQGLNPSNAMMTISSLSCRRGG